MTDEAPSCRRREPLVSRSRASEVRGLPGGHAVDPGLRALLIERLNRCALHHSVDAALAKAEVVAELLFHGNRRLLRANARSHATLVSLASTPGLQCSYSELWRCIGLYTLTDQVPVDVLRSLGKTRATALLPLREGGGALRVATQSLELGWSRQELVEVVRRQAAVAGQRRTGPRIRPEWLKGIRVMRRGMQQALSARIQVEQLAPYTPFEVDAFLAELKEVSASLAALDAQVRRVVVRHAAECAAPQPAFPSRPPTIRRGR
jgi:hypothetical protein